MLPGRKVLTTSSPGWAGCFRRCKPWNSTEETSTPSADCRPPWQLFPRNPSRIPWALRQASPPCSEPTRTELRSTRLRQRYRIWTVPAGLPYLVVKRHGFGEVRVSFGLKRSAGDRLRSNFTAKDSSHHVVILQRSVKPARKKE